jgi:hypothetical protein
MIRNNQKKLSLKSMESIDSPTTAPMTLQSVGENPSWKMSLTANTFMDVPLEA